MAEFGWQSEKQLKTCHPVLQIILNRAIRIMDFSVLVGNRDEQAQNAAYASGVSQVPYPQSKHNAYPSLAVDVAPYPIDWDDTERFVLLAGVIKAIAFDMGVVVRWGGDWDQDDQMSDERFRDYGHFEIGEEDELWRT